MDAFGGGAALDVGDVGFEHLLKEFQGPIAVGPGQHPRMNDTAQCRPVRRAGDRAVTILGVPDDRSDAIESNRVERVLVGEVIADADR